MADPSAGMASGHAGVHAAGEDFAQVLARFACRLASSALPAEALAAAKVNVFDTLACAAAGSSAPAVGDALALAQEWGGAPQATIFCFGDKVPAHHAAWVNGTMSHARDYDDTHDAAVLHAGVTVVPAAIAAMELNGGASGDTLVAAVAAGLETVCRLGVATKIGIVESGFIYTPLFGHFAATVAAGRVLDLTESQMVNALGIAYSQVAGNHQVTRDGALTKRMQPGFAAQASLTSVQLARRGVRGAQATFEGVDGFFRVYLHDQVDRAALRDELGRRYEFAQLSYKPYPCCRFNHTAIDAALQLRAAGTRAADVARIRVGLTRQAFEAVCTPEEVRKRPRTIVHAQFSVPYTVATALLDGAVGLAHFSESAIGRADIIALASRIHPFVDDAIEREWGRNISPSELHVERVDGSSTRVRVDLPLGHPQCAMSDADFDRKAADCFATAAVEFPRDRAGQLRAMVNDLQSFEDARALVRVLVPDR